MNFLRRSQADQEDANVFQKMIEKCSKIIQNQAFWRPCSGPSSWRGSRVIIFRLLAIEKLSWNFFFRVLVDFRQFLGSQHGLNFDLKMALKSILGVPGPISPPKGRPDASRGAFFFHFWSFWTPVSHLFHVMFLFVSACVLAFALCFLKLSKP